MYREKNRGKMNISAFAVNLMGRKVKEAVDGVNASLAQDKTEPMKIVQGLNWTF
jgi:hypothetical protein